MDCCFGGSGLSLSVAVVCYGLSTRGGYCWVAEDCYLGKSGLSLWVDGGFLWVIADVVESWVLVAVVVGMGWRLGGCWVCFRASFDALVENLTVRFYLFFIFLIYKSNFIQIKCYLLFNI